jgi:hypothetical protein
MASLAEIQALVEQIKSDLPLLINRSQIAPKQIVTITGLSDISERLGLVQAGEFRAGNGVEPGFGFKGVRMGYPAFAYANDTWHLAGVNNDVLQFGLSATDGKGYFAAGKALVGSDGMILEAQNNQSYFILWKTDDDQTIVGKIGAFYVSTDAGIEVVGQAKSGFVPVAHLMTADADGNFLTGIEVRGDGQMQLDMRTSTNQAANGQTVRLMSRISNTNTTSEILKLELETTGTAAAGFGLSMPVYVENNAGVMRQIGGFSWVYTSAANGAESSKLLATYMASGGFQVRRVSTYHMLPFTPYGATTLAGITGTTPLVMAAIDRNLTLHRWTVTWNVTSANDASNYYTIRLISGNYGVVASFNTIGGTVGPWNQNTITSFVGTAINAAGRYLYMDIVKTGSPAAINIASPIVEVYES